MLTNWWKEILNYFLERVTNGFVEGFNGQSEVLSLEPSAIEIFKILSYASSPSKFFTIIRDDPEKGEQKWLNIRYGGRVVRL